MTSTRLVIFTCAVILLFTGRAAFAIDNLRVAYPSMNTSVFAVVIAQKEGYFKEEGLNVELLSIRGEIAIRTTLAGEVDFFTNAGSALAAAVRGVPVRLVTVFQDKPGWDLISEPEIKSIAQLRGKTIGVMSPEGSLAVVAREILRKNGAGSGNKKDRGRHELMTHDSQSYGRSTQPVQGKSGWEKPMR